jgi:hypothetical protein
MTMKIRLTRRTASTGIVYALTVYAFVNSYLHGVSWAQAHSTHEHHSQGFAWGTASIPELILISVLLRGRFDRKAFIGGLMSVGWTLWVNGAGAAPGISGMVVALAAPVAALYCAWVSDHSSDQPEEAEPVAQVQLTPAQKGQLTKLRNKAQKEAQAQGLSAEEVAQRVAQVQAPSAAQDGSKVALTLDGSGSAQKAPKMAQNGSAPRKGTKVAQGAIWLRAQSEAQSIADIMAAQNCSLATAKRIREAVFGPVNKTGKTDEESAA